MTIPRTPEIFDEKKIKPIVKWISTTWRALLAEFIATMLLITFGCMSCVPIEGYTPHPSLFGPLGFGLTVMINIQIFGHISGAFMNPFVTIIAVIWGLISVPVAVAYILVECAGAIVGYGILIAVAPVDVAGQGICLTVPNGISEFQALGVEILLTAALSLVNCAVFDPVNKHNTDSIPLKFGFTIAGLSIAGGHLTGAGMNPARSLAPAVWANRWDGHWVFWVGPLVGGIIPAIFYKYVWLQKSDSKLQN